MSNCRLNRSSCCGILDSQHGVTRNLLLYVVINVVISPLIVVVRSNLFSVRFVVEFRLELTPILKEIPRLCYKSSCLMTW